MTTATVNIEDLRALIADVLETEPEEVTDEAHFTDELDIDSLMRLEIETRVEHMYGAPENSVAISGVNTLAELHAFITVKLVGKDLQKYHIRTRDGYRLLQQTQVNSAGYSAPAPGSGAAPE